MKPTGFENQCPTWLKHVTGSLENANTCYIGTHIEARKRYISFLSFFSRREKPLLVGVVSKTKQSKTKTEARSTQISKTKHPKLENEAPYLENEAPKTRKRRPLNLENEAPKTRKRSTLDRKRSTQKLDTGLSFINTRPMLIQQESSTITNRILLFPTIEPGPRLLP